MRVVAGRFRGRPLASPEHEGLRPTSDRVRQAIFNILEHGVAGFRFEGQRVLDLFAGTGALGIEALSRGADYCLFVEQSAEARGLIRTNLDGLGLGGATRIFRRDATDLGPAGATDRFTLVLADPPYGRGLGELALASAGAGGWLADGAVAVLEERADCEITLPLGFTVLDDRAWGDTRAVFARWSAVTSST